MSVLEWVVVAGLVLLGVSGTAILPRMWRDRWTRLPEEPPDTWPYGHVMWRGFVRAAPIGGPVALIFAATVVSETIVFAEPLEGGLDILVHILAPLVLLVLSTVILLNWPKWILPPHLRNEPGAIRGWTSSPRPVRPEEPE
jgi:hypothetical protein